jgi:hypothetical protein
VVSWSYCARRCTSRRNSVHVQVHVLQLLHRQLGSKRPDWRDAELSRCDRDGDRDGVFTSDGGEDVGCVCVVCLLLLSMRIWMVKLKFEFRLLRLVSHHKVCPRIVIVTGDLADTGERPADIHSHEEARCQNLSDCPTAETLCCPTPRRSHRSSLTAKRLMISS